MGIYIWSNFDDEKLEITKKKASGITPLIDQLVYYFDNQLSAILEDTNHLFKYADSTPENGTKLQSHAAKPYFR